MATLITTPSLGPMEEAFMPTENPILSDEECLKERKWWCFLLSSIFTFIMGVLSVVVVRGIASICCHKDEDEFSQAELRRQEEETKKLRLQGQNPDGSSASQEGDFMSEAKDWAGELIYGQTGTGRILVSVKLMHKSYTGCPVKIRIIALLFSRKKSKK
jgi:hypothetical protein